MRIFTLILSLFFLHENVCAQPLTSFFIQQVQNSMRLQFTIKGGNTCNGIDILRSDDSLLFSYIGNIDGICGSSNVDVSYTFIDSLPLKNADNFYKLDLKQLGFSPTLKIHYYDQSTEISIFPNPSSTFTTIYFRPEYGHRASIRLFDVQGREVIQRKDLFTNPFQLNTESLLKGIYYLSLLIENEIELNGVLLKE